MKRRELLKLGLLGAVATPVIGSKTVRAFSNSKSSKLKKAKNIIFMVSDGMSIGTLTMANLLSERKLGKSSTWTQLYKDGRVTRGLMDMASANSMVTDSSAASSSWGGGMRINNNAVNYGPNGEKPVPILQKFKSVGKAVGCVTTVPITHATPSGFCVNNEYRKNQPEIAQQYLDLKFDVMMGGGQVYFRKDSRKDNLDLLQNYRDKGYHVALDKTELMKADGSKPIMAPLADNALPYYVDHMHSEEHQKNLPTLSEMTSKALEVLNQNKKGFVVQIEGGKVDWAAHGNDAPALVYEQLEFENALKVAVDFAEKDGETLVVITTDHGNANPGLFYGKEADSNFDKLQTIKGSNEFLFSQIPDNATVKKVQALFKDLQNVSLSAEQAKFIADRYKVVPEEDRYDNRRLPFKDLAEFQREDFSIHFADTHHSGDYVELAMMGPGSEWLKPFTVNTELHQFMLDVTETQFKG